MDIAKPLALLVKVNPLSYVYSYHLIRSRQFSIFEGVDVVRRAIELSEIELNLDTDSDHVTSSYGVVTTGKFNVKSAAVDTLEISPGAKGFVSNFAYEISRHRCYEREMELTSRVGY